ncbi:MAG: aminoacyl-histidine dipeptidase [Bacteroidales bacterium]|nr:aminoacyl-histidine dipeptidase [Bacteroidales bacterium]
MNEEMLNLKPAKVFYYFNEITKIPRPSKKEAKMSEWLEKTGIEMGLPTKRDKVGNVLISKPATPGKENVTPVIFQAHMDMVCEKNNDTDFDFEKDAIQTYIDGEWLKAKGTTLGADDGIGVAMALAILADKELQHGPIECLFTIDEETGLTGANELEPGFMSGKMLINLDSEDEGQFFIGCAGGMDTVATMECDYEAVKDLDDAPYQFFKLTVKGLQGGHSGDDINKGRGNAVKLLARLLWNAYCEYGVRIVDIKAGNLRNAIAREGYAVVAVPEVNAESLSAYIKDMDATYKSEFHATDAGVMVVMETAEKADNVFEETFQIDLMNALMVCPHGVQAMSQDIPGFVETSTNLASVKKEDDKIIITTSQRSSVESRKQAVVDKVATTFWMVGADVQSGEGYPGWTPNPDSEVLRVLVDAYKNLYKKEPQVLAIHAGLECGLFSEKYPGLDMVSIGPTMRGVHSPDEKLEIKTVQMCWDLLIEFFRLLK